MVTKEYKGLVSCGLAGEISKTYLGRIITSKNPGLSEEELKLKLIEAQETVLLFMDSITVKKKKIDDLNQFELLVYNKRLKAEVSKLRKCR